MRHSGVPTSTAPVSSAAFAMKAVTFMGSMISSPPDEPDVIDMAAFGRDLARRRAALGVTDVPRNAGNRRTASKRALLAAIDKAGGRW